MDMKRKNKLLISAVLMFLLGINLIAGSSNLVLAQEKTFNLKYAGFMPATDTHERVAAWWSKEVEKRTNGRVKVTLYHGATLGNLFDFPKMLKAGVCDISLLPTAAAEFPMFAPFYAPNMVLNSAIATDVFWTLYYKGLFKELDDYKPLCWQSNDPFYFLFKDKKVTRMEDLKGLKLRGLPGFGAAYNNALGATGVALPASEVYMAIDRGTLDGASTTANFSRGAKLHEVMKYWLWEPLFTGGNILAMTKKTWDRFPADIQVIMQQLNDEARVVYMEGMKTPPQERESLRQQGWEIYQLSDAERMRWQKVADKLIEDWIAENEKKGYPAKEVVSAIKRVNEYFQ
ncbi:MAG: TRAP transporter substrate-binding protein DctP [Deltaproteobacteria bacterium]|nr:TRAP transporter substrate-binding protein DctP [Deltaproteobacteria bacterium]